MSKKIFMYGSFIIACLVAIVLFVTSRTYTQLAVATVLYTLLAYLAFKVFPSKARKKTRYKHKPVIAVQPVRTIAENVGVVDSGKRDFLKMVWAAGISFFVLSIFTKRAEALFFGKAVEKPGAIILKDPSGADIIPAKEQPTDGYQISDIDYGDYIFYYGFTKPDGAWFIMEEDLEAGSFRYTKGQSDFHSGWSNRGHLKYDYFYNTFP
ncbi:hypothetical protein ACFL13_02945 [Patescibacteria group bacterium]